MVSFYLPMEMDIISAHVTGEEGGSERGSNLPEVTELVCQRAELQVLPDCLMAGGAMLRVC